MQQCLFCKDYTVLLPNGLCNKCIVDDRKVFTLIQMGIEGKALLERIIYNLNLETLNSIESDIKKYFKTYDNI